MSHAVALHLLGSPYAPGSSHPRGVRDAKGSRFQWRMSLFNFLPPRDAIWRLPTCIAPTPFCFGLDEFASGVIRCARPPLRADPVTPTRFFLSVCVRLWPFLRLLRLQASVKVCSAAGFLLHHPFQASPLFAIVRATTFSVVGRTVLLFR